MNIDTLNRLITKFNAKCDTLDYTDIPESLETDFSDRVCEIEGLVSISSICKAEIDGQFVDIEVSYCSGDYESDTELTTVCLYDHEFESWCKELGIGITELKIIKNEPKKFSDIYDRKKTNPTRNGLKLVA